MNKYQLSITKDYCHDWSVENAVRELFQNQLDSPAEGGHTYDGNTLTITSKDMSIPTKTLLLGATTKRNEDDSVGGKGEGYKLACGILLREGLEVEVHNGSVKWTPVFEYHPDFDEEVLFFYEEPLPDNNDLSFIVSGIGEEVFNRIKEENLYLRDDVTDILEGERGNVIKNFGGKIFVGGLYVCEEPRLKYSYDFKPQYLPLNRDRRSVDDWDLRLQTYRLLESLFEMNDLVDDIKQGTYDTQLAKYDGSGSVKDACFYAFAKENEGCIVAETESDKEELSKKYQGKPVILNNSDFSAMVTGSYRYKEYLRDNEKPEYEEDTRTPLDIIKLLEDCDLSPEAQGKLNQIISIFEEKGVYWNDETIEIPF